MRVCSYITDPVTTTDELIPSGDTSSYRSNPERLSEFALSRKDPGYVGRAKAVRAQEQQRAAGQIDAEIARVYAALRPYAQPNPQAVNIGSVIFANKPGDGSAREQAASLPARAGRLRQSGTRICHQALPLQLHQLGHAASADG